MCESESKNQTALVSAFSKAYHYKNNTVRVFGDPLAGRMLSETEYDSIGENMANGSAFFDSALSGSKEEKLRAVADRFLSPAVLEREAFAEEKMKDAVSVGAEQILLLASGLSTFPYRQPMWAEPLEIFELDLPEMIAEKKARLEKGGIAVPENVHFMASDLTSDSFESVLTEDFCFDPDAVTVCTLLGITCYLSPDELKKVLKTLSRLLPEGSSIVFDYCRAGAFEESKKSGSEKREVPAAGAGQPMKSSFTYEGLEKLLTDCGLLIYEHCEPETITNKYFARYNFANKANKMKAAGDVNLCFAVKKEL